MKSFHKVISIMLATFLMAVNLSSLSSIRLTAGSAGSVMPVDFEGYDSLESMTSAGLVTVNENFVRSHYSLNKDPLYAQSGDSSLRLDFKSNNNDAVSYFEIDLAQTPADADGISFWYYNPGALTVNGVMLAVTENGTRYKFGGSATFTMGAQMGSFQKYTLRFDDCGLLADGALDNTARVPNTSPTKDIVATFKKIVFRVFTIRNGQSIYLDSFDWINDRDIEAFDQSPVLPSNITITGRLNNQSNTEFWSSSIIDSDSDTGNALKIDFGSVEGEPQESNNDMINTRRMIMISINTAGMNLNGDALRLWMKNTSSTQVGVRIRLTDKNGQGHRKSGGNIWIPPKDGDKHFIVRSDYSEYRQYANVFYNNAATNPLSNFTAADLQGIKTLDICIFPRTPNNGGSLIIDGISVVNPKEVTGGNGDFGEAVISGNDGIARLTKTTVAKGTEFKLTDCDFYAAGGYIQVPISASINPNDDGYVTLDAIAPGTTKLKLSLLDDTQAVAGTAYVGLIPGPGGDPVKVKVPISDFNIGSGIVRIENLKIEAADDFNNSYNFLKYDEAIVFNNLEFVDTDPGEDVKQNKDVTASAVSTPLEVAAIDLPASYPSKDSGTLYLSKTDSEDELVLRLSGIDFYQVKNYIVMKPNEDFDFWAYKDIGYFVFEVKAPRDTKLAVAFYDNNWAAVSGTVGVKSAGNGYVKVKIPLKEIFSKRPATNFSAPRQIRINIVDEFKNSTNFLNVGESISFKNMKIVADDPGVAFTQNKTMPAKPVPAENVIDAISSDDVSIVTGSGALYLEKTAGEGDINLKLKDNAYFTSANRIKLAVDPGTIRSCLETGYLIFDVKAPRNTKLNLAFSNAAGDVKVISEVGIADASEDFASFKVPLKDMLLNGAVNTSVLTELYLEVNQDFRTDFNFLKVNEVISFKNMRIIDKDSFVTLTQNKDLVPLAFEPKTPEDIDQEETRLIFQDKGPYSDAKNNSATAHIITTSTVAMKRSNPDYEFFGRYHMYTVNDQDAYYEKSWPLQISNAIAEIDRDMTDYLNTATIRFWARVEKDMTINVSITNRDYKGISIPVQMTAASDERFTEYRISFKEIYEGLLAANPNYTYDFTHIYQIRFAPVTKTPEGFLASGESICVAGVEIWSKEPVVYNRFESEILSFSYSGNDVQIDAYYGALPKETVVEVKNIPFSEAELWNLDFGAGTDIVMFKTITLFNAENSRIEPSAKIWVSFKIPDGVDIHELGLYQVFFDGYSERLQYVVEGDMVAIHTYTVGSFVLVTGVEQENEIIYNPPTYQDNTNEDTYTENTNTGEETYMIILAFILMALSGGVLVRGELRKKKQSRITY